jgi:hypothetical protein
MDKMIKEKMCHGLRRWPNDEQTHNSQPKTFKRDRGMIQHEARPGGDVRGTNCDRRGGIRVRMM